MSELQTKTFQLRRRNDNGEPAELVLELEKADRDGKPTGSYETHSFTFYPARVPALVGLDLAGMRVNMNYQPMWDLFHAMMPDLIDGQPDRTFERFRDTLRSPEWVIEADELRDILQWMTEQSGERPT